MNVVCNYCTDVFPISLDLPTKTYTTTKGGEEVWTCDSCQKKTKGVF